MFHTHALCFLRWLRMRDSIANLPQANCMVLPSVCTGQSNSPLDCLDSDRFESLTLPTKKTTPYGVVFCWQRMRDSNPRKRSQSPVCYRYTNPLNEEQLYYNQIFQNVNSKIPKTTELENIMEQSQLHGDWRLATGQSHFDRFESCCRKNKSTPKGVLLFLVETTGLEPVTSCV